MSTRIGSELSANFGPRARISLVAAQESPRFIMGVADDHRDLRRLRGRIRVEGMALQCSFIEHRRERH